NSLQDAGEPTATTDASGIYAFGGIGPGTYRPRVVIPTGAYQTSSTLALITPTSGATSANNDIGLFTYGVISGTVFTDDNGDGVMNGSEAGVANLRVFSDTNSSNTYNTGEPSVLTDANGNFVLDTLKSGTYKPRLVVPNGETLSTSLPATVTVVSGTAVTN